MLVFVLILFFLFVILLFIMVFEELYEVERIVDKRKNKKGKIEYLVWWKGYDSEDDIWELE